MTLNLVNINLNRNSTRSNLNNLNQTLISVMHLSTSGLSHRPFVVKRYDPKVLVPVPIGTGVQVFGTPQLMFKPPACIFPCSSL